MYSLHLSRKDQIASSAAYSTIILKNRSCPVACYCNTVVRHQGEPADQEPCWHCQEGRLCTWLRVPHHSAGSCTKVSAALVWLVLKACLDTDGWFLSMLQGCSGCWDILDAYVASPRLWLFQDGIRWLAENIWNTGWDGGAPILKVSNAIMSNKMSETHFMNENPEKYLRFW